MKRVGVLGLQGSVEEHLAMLERIDGAEGVNVKTVKELETVDGLILPGGESTTISKLLRIFGLFEPLRDRIENGMPVWGTCAGLILLAKKIIGEEAHLGVMDICAERNAYGRQIDSFSTEARIEEFDDSPIPLVFIRAPWIESAGEGVDVLCTVDGHIAAARQKNMLATAFHPELTDNAAAHKYFLSMME